MSFIIETNIRQKFNIPHFLISYISQNSVEVLQKLLLTCKYFYLKYKIVPCYMLAENWTNKEYKWEISKKLQNIIKNQNPIKLWLFGRLFLNTFIFKISKIAPKIFRCDIMQLEFSHTTFLFNELKILFSSIRLRKFSMHSGLILYPDKTVTPVEAILIALPYVDNFFLYPSNTQMYAKKSFHSLSKTERFRKFERFWILDVPSNFDLSLFKCFVMKHVLPDAILGVTFENETEDKILAEFKESLISEFQFLEICKY